VRKQKAAQSKEIGACHVGDTALDNVSTTGLKGHVSYVVDTPNRALENDGSVVAPGIQNDIDRGDRTSDRAGDRWPVRVSQKVRRNSRRRRLRGPIEGSCAPRPFIELRGRHRRVMRLPWNRTIWPGRLG
jgi:hypothetical protein